MKQQNSAAAEEFEANIRAFTYPDEFAECDGTVSFGKGLSIDKQPRKPFDLCYRTLIGNDTEGIDHGYILHIVYNALVAPSNRAYETYGEDAAITEFDWPITTTPVVIAGRKASAHFKIDSTKTDPYLLGALEELLYGAGSTDAMLPTATQLVTLFDQWETLVVVDEGDGTATISGPDSVVTFLSETEFMIQWGTVVEFDPDTYQINSDNEPDTSSMKIFEQRGASPTRLIPSWNDPDLYSSTGDGIYELTDTTNLVPTETEGIYEIE